ncbi:MAG: methylmalonyl-CoA mutase family protein [Marinifilaceae bacterium]
MAEQMKNKLFSEFAPNTMQEWMEKVTADLKGADFNKKLVWKTNEGFSVQPMYRLEDMEGLRNLESFPGEFPYVRGNNKESNDWYVRQDIVVEDIEKANAKALEILNRGVNSLGFVFTGCTEVTKEQLAALLKGIELDCIEINFVAECKKKALVDAFVALVAERGYAADKIFASINIDPLTQLTLKGKTCCDNPFAAVKEVADKTAAFKNFKTIGVGGYVFNNSGASVVQELAFALAEGADYLDKLTDAGMSVNDITPRMYFHFGVGSKYFMEIAKFRAARYLWSKIVKAYEPACDSVCKMHIHAQTSQWNKTLYDPNVNMLRTQTEAMSAAIGGVESMTVHSYDYIFACNPSEIGERVARNQQLLLKEESHFSKIVDPSGGAYYIEELTEYIAEAAWKLFIQVQEEGGYAEAFKKGFVQAAVKETAAARDKDIATRRENLLGTNQFPNFNEVITSKVCDCVLHAEDMTAPDAQFETLKPYRGAQAFEAMRLKTDAYSVEHGRPVVYMFPMGNLAMRKARAQFACNFFACAGFDVKDNNGFATVEEGIAACKENKAAIVVICSADDEYATIAPEIYKQLGDSAVVVVAGNPECRAELEENGITNFVHVKNNVLEELKRYQQLLGL